MNLSNLKTNRFFQILPYLLLFVLSTFYFYYFANYIFFFQEKSALFLTTFSFFTEHLKQPGGFLMYLGEFQNALYFNPLLGAILVSAEFCLVIYLLSVIGKKITGSWVYFVPFLVGAAICFLQTHYQYNSFNTIGIILQLIFLYVAIVFLKGKLEWISVLIFPIIYYLTGSFSILFLITMVIYFVLKKEKGVGLKLLVLAGISILFFYVGQQFLFYRTIKSLLIYPFEIQQTGMQTNLFVPVIFIISGLPLFYWYSKKSIEKLNKKRFPLLQITPIIAILILVSVAPARIDKKNSHYFYVEKLFYQQKYKEIIAFNTQFPSTNMLTNYLNNIALSETGVLNDLFFNFPQSKDGGTLFLKWELVVEVLKRGGYFYYSAGLINEAQRWAYEYMVMKGITPEGLKMLIKTELINGNYNVATKYIDILKQSLFYKNEAVAFEKLLFNETAIDIHPELGRKKALKAKQDFFVLSDEPEINLDLILKADSTNNIVLEYKMAWLMLQKDLAQIAKELPMLEKCGYKRIPKNIEEAIVAYKLLNVGEMPELETLIINPQTEQSFSRYYQIFQQNSTDKAKAQRALYQEFGNTFWYYVFFS